MLDEDVDLNVFNYANDAATADKLIDMAKVINATPGVVRYYPFVWCSSGVPVTRYVRVIGSGRKFVDEAVFKAKCYLRHRADIAGVLQVYKGGWDICWTVGAPLPAGFPDLLLKNLPRIVTLEPMAEYSDAGSW